MEQKFNSLKDQVSIYFNFYVSTLTHQIEEERNLRETLKQKYNEENKAIETKLKNMFVEEREVIY